MAVRYLRFQVTKTAQATRAPLLERMLARADASAVQIDWRAEAFRIIAPQTPIPELAPVAYYAAGGPRRSGWVCLATPVHYVAELSNVRLAEDGLLSLDAADAQSLARDFNRDWRDAGIHLWADSGRLFLVFDTALEVASHAPQQVRGQHLESFLPTGRDAKRVRRLMSEIEMWLFGHALNLARRQRGALPLSALWLWGGGTPLAGQAADIMIVHAVPASAEWCEMQACWLTETLTGLKRGDVTRLELSAGERRFVLGARWRRRFWRRAKPWWEYFE